MSALVETAGYRTSVPHADTREFRNALGQYGTGVAVITTTSAGQPLGMTVNSFAALSLDPPLVLWSVRTDSSRRDAFVHAARFAVNVLASHQLDVARAVATTPTDGDAFTRFGWQSAADGIPLIDGALARFECRPSAVLAGGDHEIIVGEVDRCSVTDGEPLLFVQGGYAAPVLLDALSPTGGSHPAGTEARGADVTLAELITAAHHRLSLGFDAHRQEFGLTVASNRVLKRLTGHPQTTEELAASAFLGPRAVEDALAELTEAGLVSRDGDTYSQTSAGHIVREQLSDRARALNETAVGHLPAADVATARRVLATLATSNEQNHHEGESQ